MTTQIQVTVGDNRQTVVAFASEISLRAAARAEAAAALIGTTAENSVRFGPGTSNGGTTGSVAIGHNAVNDANNQVVIGSVAARELKLGATVMFRYNAGLRNYFALNAGNHTVTGGANLGIGETALASVTTGTNNVAVGDLAMQQLTTTTGSVALGARAMEKSVTGIDCVYIGFEAGQEALSGVGDSAVGRRALGKATVHRNNSVLGDSGFWLYQGSQSEAIGYRVAEYWLTGTRNTVLGTAAGANRSNGSRNVIIGGLANDLPQADEPPGTLDPLTGAGALTAGDGNVILGAESARRFRGSYMVAVGQATFANLIDGDRHIGIGNLAGDNITGGSGSIFIGDGAGDATGQKVDPVNAIAIGKSVVCTADNQIVIGRSDATEFVVAGVSFTKAQLLALKALVA